MLASVCSVASSLASCCSPVTLCPPPIVSVHDFPRTFASYGRHTNSRCVSLGDSPVIANGVRSHPLSLRYPARGMEDHRPCADLYVATDVFPPCDYSSLVLRAVCSRILFDGPRAFRAMTYTWGVALRAPRGATSTLMHVEQHLMLTSMAQYCWYVPSGIRCSMRRPCVPSKRLHVATITHT